MRILVLNVAAEHGGALTILREFYNEVSANSNNIEWNFVISTPILDNKGDYLRVYRYPWVKKSWLHRLFFDYFIAPRLVRKLEPDVVFSMQNICVNGIPNKQVIYLHQPLPFSTISFSFFKNLKLWIYQNILSHKIITSIKKADKVIVQTQWMRDAAMKKAKVNQSKFKVIPPSFDSNNQYNYRDTYEARKVFFYPASYVAYKNHIVILNAARLLIEDGYDNFEIVFTGTQKQAIESGIKVEDLPVRFTGSLTHEEVLKQMSCSVLVFPSLLETYGLPLAEARMVGSLIIASDLPFSREILDGYPNVYYFDPRDDILLYKLLKSVLDGKVKYKDIEKLPNDQTYEKSTWKDVVEELIHVK